MSPPAAAAAPALDAVGHARGRAALAAVESPVEQPFAVFESKIRIPTVRAGTLPRTGLVESAAGGTNRPAGDDRRTVGVRQDHPARQWAARDERPVAWLTVDARDDDPLVLLRHLAAAFARIEPLDPGVLDALAAPDPSLWRDAAPRLATAIASRRNPFVAVLDDADVLGRGASADLVAALAEQVPIGSTLAVAGRGEPALPLARLRANGNLLELGTDELALSRRESLLLVQAAGVDLGDDEAADLAARSEGWPAGLHLATLALRGRGRLRSDHRVGGDDRFLADYFRSEHLSRLTAPQQEFLRRTSVLEHLTADLCDAVLERTDSASELAAIEREGRLLLVPLDHHGGRYRYHRFFAELLRRELELHEPALVPGLHRRAADWQERHGDPEGALEHALASGDVRRAARILTTIGLPGDGPGPAAVERWLETLTAHVQDEAYPGVAALGAWVHALRGRPAEAQLWLERAELECSEDALTDGCASARPWVALVRAALCVDGVERMGQDADAALAELPSTSPWQPTALVVQGVAQALRDDPVAAETTFVAAAGAAERSGDRHSSVLATSQRSLLAASADDHEAAERLALEALELEARDTVVGTRDARSPMPPPRARSSGTAAGRTPTSRSLRRNAWTRR